MKQENWAKNDYQTGLSFIADNEDKATSNTLLGINNDVTVILPSGLQLYGAGFYGIFMLAPIVLFMLILTYFIFFILMTHSFEIQTKILFSLGGLILLWGLTKALNLLLSTRDLFPRIYFSTLGHQGISANYSKLHFPVHSRVAIKWDEIESTRIYLSFFLPGLFSGVFKTTILEITSKGGRVLKIPFHASDEEALLITQKIADLINQKRTH